MVTKHDPLVMESLAIADENRQWPGIMFDSKHETKHVVLKLPQPAHKTRPPVVVSAWFGIEPAFDHKTRPAGDGIPAIADENRQWPGSMFI